MICGAPVKMDAVTTRSHCNWKSLKLGTVTTGRFYNWTPLQIDAGRYYNWTPLFTGLKLVDPKKILTQKN